MSMQSRVYIYLALALLPFILILHLNAHLELERHTYHHRHIDLSDDPLPFSSDEVLAASLNYSTAAADILWIQSLMYRSDRRAIRQPPRQITAYTDAIIDLDPYFHPVYGWHNTFRFRALPDPTLEDLTEANRILEKGLKYFPADWQMAQTLAINLNQNRYDLNAEERLKQLNVAYKYTRQASQLDNAPPQILGLALNFRRRIFNLEEGRPERGDIVDGELQLGADELEFLIHQYFTADDPQNQRFLRFQLASMGAEEELLEQIDAYERKLRRHHLLSYPYVTPEFLAVVDVDLYLWHDADGL